jgi:hypothetical protein
MTVCTSFSQRRIRPEKDPLDIMQFISKATGVHGITGFYSSIISPDSVILEHISFYDKNGIQVNLYDKQVDSLLVANHCREKIYPEIKKYLNL